MLNRTWMCSFLLTAALPVVVLAQHPVGNHQNEEQAVRALDASMQSAARAHDINKVASMYAADATFMETGAPAVSGAGIRKSWMDLFALPGQTLTWTPTRITVASSGDMANETGTYQLSYTGPNGKVNDAGNFVTVWRRTGGQWKIATDAVISSTPPAAPAAPAASTPAVASAEMSEMSTATSMEARAGSGLTWTDLALPGFPAGTKVAVLHGDPSKAGDYVMRLQFPDNYQIPLHWHPGAEHVTVLSGNLYLGMGGTGSQSAAQAHAPGDFVYIPARMAHSGYTKGVTVVQLHGTGPFATTLGMPK